MTKCVRFSAVILFVFAIAFFVTACGDGGGGATYSSYFVPPAPSPTEPVLEPTVAPTVAPTPDPTVAPKVAPTPDPTPDPTPAYENPFKGANVGDMVKFGRYPQTEGGGDKDDIEWQVLSVEGGKILAISRYGLDAKRFDDDSNDWESSEICGWLNGEFYEGSFNDDEKGIIASSDPGKVFLLSKDEAEGYFDSDDDRKCLPTGYAKANDALVSEGFCFWWLRSSYSSFGVYYVRIGGGINYSNVNDNSGSARPALWINTES